MLAVDYRTIIFSIHTMTTRAEKPRRDLRMRVILDHVVDGWVLFGVAAAGLEEISQALQNGGPGAHAGLE